MVIASIIQHASQTIILSLSTLYLPSRINQDLLNIWWNNLTSAIRLGMRRSKYEVHSHVAKATTPKGFKVSQPIYWKLRERQLPRIIENMDVSNGEKDYYIAWLIQ